MVSHAPPGEGVLTLRVWHDDDGGFRARILRPRPGAEQPESLVVRTPHDALAAVGDWLADLTAERDRS